MNRKEWQAWKKVAGKIGIDGTIALTLLTRIVQAAGAIGVILVIARFLTNNLQGYYYTFASILAVQVFFELGLTGIITQYAAHEFAYLKVDESFDIIGEEYYKSRLSSILHFCVKWFGIVAFFLFFLLLAIGFYFFSSYGNDVLRVNWQFPWIILSASTSLNLLIDPTLAFLDGIGRIKEMSKIRLAQKTVNVILLFGLLIFNFKLYSSAIASLVSVLLIYVLLFTSINFKLLKNIWGKKSNWVVSYVKEIFPYQWRIAISWISGYFIFQLFNPVLFATSGAITAGQMGMTLQVLNGVSLLSISWITTKVPLFSSLISGKQYKELDSVFNKTLRNLNIINNLSLFIFLIVVLLLGYYKNPLRQRLLPTLPLICMMFTVIINQYIFSWATYLRCHKKEPLLVQALTSAVYCCVTTLFFGRLYGLMGIVVPYAFWSVISVVWVYFIYRNKKEEWHGDNGE